MNTEVMETVLHEVLNEQKETGKLSKQLISKLEYLSEQIEKIKAEMNRYQKASTTPNPTVQKDLVQKQIMIFPEFKSPECYRLLFKCITSITIETYSFLIIKAVADYWCR